MRVFISALMFAVGSIIVLTGATVGLNHESMNVSQEQIPALFRLICLGMALVLSGVYILRDRQ